MLGRMNLLLFYGLLHIGILQCTRIDKEVPSKLPSKAIFAPDPDDIQLELEDTEVQLVENDINLCADMADYTLLPVVGNCSNYISCINSTIDYKGTCYTAEYIKESCDNNLENCNIVFNAKTQSCEEMNAGIKCLPQCQMYNLTSYCYDGTCTKYVLCYYGVPVLRKCYNGLQYNAETDRCDFPQYVDCVENECPQDKNLANIVYIPSKANCNKYYICSDGEPWSQECTNGLLFNPKCNCCDYPSNVNCSLTIQQRNIQPFSRSPPRRADIICPVRGVNFYPHKSLKDAYYYCVDGHGVTLDCTPGLLYNSKLQECVLPQYVDSSYSDLNSA